MHRWKYAEQASWSLTKEEYMQRLNYYAAVRCNPQHSGALHN
jgi:hypothetical protein